MQLKSKVTSSELKEKYWSSYFTETCRAASCVKVYFIVYDINDVLV